MQMEVTWNIFRRLRSLKTHDSDSVRVFWGGKEVKSVKINGQIKGIILQKKNI